MNVNNLPKDISPSFTDHPYHNVNKRTDEAATTDADTTRASRPSWRW